MHKQQIVKAPFTLSKTNNGIMNRNKLVFYYHDKSIYIAGWNITVVDGKLSCSKNNYFLSLYKNRIHIKFYTELVKVCYKKNKIDKIKMYNKNSNLQWKVEITQSNLQIFYTEDNNKLEADYMLVDKIYKKKLIIVSANIHCKNGNTISYDSQNYVIKTLQHSHALSPLLQDLIFELYDNNYCQHLFEMLI